LSLVTAEGASSQMELLPVLPYWWIHNVTYRKAPSALRCGAAGSSIHQDFESAI